MRRKTALFSAAMLVAGAALVVAGPTLAYSDGYAGGSGAVPWYFLDCNTEKDDYCKFTPPGCGSCHGQFDDMKAQRGSEQPVVDRISAKILLNGLDYDPDNPSSYTYEPGRQTPYQIDIYLITDRAPGRYSKAGFDLNVSAGRFELVGGDTTARITGGELKHAGSKDPNQRICDPNNPARCEQRGAVTEDESDWAGELTHTSSGAELAKTAKGYHWKVRWYAPPARPPHGVAFQMGYLIANDDGIDSCVYKDCDPSKGYSDQNLWDWWSYYIPRARFLCEKGQDRAECEKNVYKAILPPTPPLNTGTPKKSDEAGFFGTPTWPLDGSVALLAAGLLLARWRSRRAR